MKKILSIIGTLGIIGTGICSTIALTPFNNTHKLHNVNDQVSPSYKWANIGMRHAVFTDYKSYDVVSNTIVKNETLKSLDFNAIKDSSLVLVEGLYSFWTYGKRNITPVNYIELTKVFDNHKNQVIFEGSISRYSQSVDHWFDIEVTLIVRDLQGVNLCNATLISDVRVEARNAIEYGAAVSAIHDNIIFVK